MLEQKIGLQLKKDLVKMWDEGKIKEGQRTPIMKTPILDSNKEIQNLEDMMNFEEIIITENLIGRLRNEIRQEGDNQC